MKATSKKNLAIAILSTIAILLAVTVYAQATEIPVRIMFERTVTWPIIWRIAGEMEGVSTAGMTGPDKIHLVSVWATKIVREHAVPHRAGAGCSARGWPGTGWGRRRYAG
jgi:hypothetical protein